MVAAGTETDAIKISGTVPSVDGEDYSGHSAGPSYSYTKI